MDINKLGQAIQFQADILFPQRTDASMFFKIYGEVAELIKAKDDAERAQELADLLILLLDYGAVHKINMLDAVISKMEVNATRKWAINELGVFQHVEPK